MNDTLFYRIFKRLSLIEWISKGGVVMALLIVASLVAIAVIMERFSFFRRCEIRQGRFLKEFYDRLDVYELKAAEDLCQQYPGPISEIAIAGLKSWDQNKENIRETIENVGSRQIKKYEANLGVLSTIASISPMLGIMGTVLGLIFSFQSYHSVAESDGVLEPSLLVGGLWQALITTVVGLALGILVQIIHNYLYTKKERMVDDLEEAGDEILSILMEKRNSQAT